MADPVSIALVGSMAATAIGAGISAYGQYQSGQAQGAMYNYQAGVQRALAGIATKNATWDLQSGEVKAQQAGLVSRAALGRQAASAGARNVAGGSVDAVRRSQVAIGQENQAILRADAAHAAYGEEVQAAEKIASGGAYDVAADTSRTAGKIAAIGTLVSGAGKVAGQGAEMASISGSGSNSVSPRWYQNPNTPEHDYDVYGWYS